MDRVGKRSDLLKKVGVSVHPTLIFSLQVTAAAISTLFYLVFYNRTMFSYNVVNSSVIVQWQEKKKSEEKSSEA